jgi:hypothetical protein
MTEENGASPEATYVLQVGELLIDVEPEETFEAWRDVATVTVPARTKRKTAIREAVKQAGLDVTADLKVRLLDAESAEVRTVRPKPPAAPEFEVA